MKNKIIKYPLLILLFIIMFIGYNNYLIYKNINQFKIKPLMLSNTEKFVDSKKYNSKYLIINGNQRLEENNNINVYTKTYELEITDLPNKEILFLNMNLNDKIEELNILIDVYTNKDNYVYGPNDFIIKNDQNNVLIINNNNISKIIIKSTKEMYDKTTLNYEINKIIFNDKKTIKMVKSKLIKSNIVAIFAVFCIICIFELLKRTNKIDMFNSEKTPKIFLIISILIGGVFSILFPLYQIPDEYTHINMIYSELNLNVNFSDISDGYGDTSRIIHDYNEKVNIDKYFDFDNDLSIHKQYKLPSINIIKHLPQALGLIIGDILSLPILLTVTISELLAVLFYSLVCYKALKILPIKKEVMMSIMLLPICIQQMGSFSYDVMLLSMCFLLISYILYYKFIKKEIRLIDYIKLFIILSIIALVKLPYALLGLLIFIIPLKKINIDLKVIKINYKNITKNTKKIIICLIPIIIIVGTIFINILKKIYFGRILLAAIRYPKSSIPLIVRTLSINKFGFIRGLTSEFGWLDTHSSIYFTIFVIISIFIINFISFQSTKTKIQNNPFKKCEIIYTYIIVIIMIFLIILAMFDWSTSINGFKDLEKNNISELGKIIRLLPMIVGVQARYFIPIIPLIVLPIYNSNVTKKISNLNIVLLLTIYYLILFVYMFILIFNRYWI